MKEVKFKYYPKNKQIKDKKWRQRIFKFKGL